MQCRIFTHPFAPKEGCGCLWLITQISIGYDIVVSGGYPESCHCGGWTAFGIGEHGVSLFGGRELDH